MVLEERFEGAGPRRIGGDHGVAHAVIGERLRGQGDY
jgi:hypothetical protein